MKTALKPGGIVCSQAGTAWANLDHVTQTLLHCKSAFPVASYGIVAVPTYPTGQIGFVLGGLSVVSTHIFHKTNTAYSLYSVSIPNLFYLELNCNELTRTKIKRNTTFTDFSKYLELFEIPGLNTSIYRVYKRPLYNK